MVVVVMMVVAVGIRRRRTRGENLVDAGVGFEEREEERKKGVTGPNGGYVAV